VKKWFPDVETVQGDWREGRGGRKRKRQFNQRERKSAVPAGIFIRKEEPCQIEEKESLTEGDELAVT